MPTVDANKQLLSAGADYSAGDWAQVGADANLDFRAQAQLLRGIDLGAGVEAGVSFDAGLHKFLSADAHGQATAAARVRAQLQVPLDLFNEAGLAVRLQAVAEASAGVSLAVGLKAGDFLALAGSDPQLKGVPFELLKIFLHELDIQGGVMAKVSAAAMAYANIAITGRLTKAGSDLPGFNIAAEAGVGLKAGAGFKVFARLKVNDPRNLMRRSIDVAVDSAIDPLQSLLPEGPMRVVLHELRTPAKIALRTSFELGLALAEAQGTFRPDDSDKLALRCVQVAFEEVQRCVLERAVDHAVRELRLALRALNFNDAAWAAAAAPRRALAARLNAVPEEPFEATQLNRDYWNGVIADVLTVAGALSPGGLTAEVRTPLALLWTTAQLLFVSVQRISNTQARVAVIGMSPVQATVPFAGPLATPPPAVRDQINAVLGRPNTTAVTQEDAIKFLLATLRHSLIFATAPELSGIIRLIAGPDADAAGAGLTVLFSNLGAFAPGADGRVSAQASLAVIRDALRSFLDLRIQNELRPLLVQAAGDNRDLLTFFDEVVLATMQTVYGPVFTTVAGWRQGDQDNQRALRELCSSLVLRLFGRSLVVVGDILLAQAQAAIRAELQQVAAHVDDPNGVAQTLQQLTRLDRSFVAEVVEEALLVCADAFVPMPLEKRAHVRSLLYQIIDTAPAPADANAVTGLRNAALIPNADAARELALLLGEEIVGNVVRFVQALLVRVGRLILEELQEVIVAIQKSVEEWVADLQQLAGELARRLVAVLAEIDRLGRALEQAGDVVLADASSLLGFVADHTTSRRKLRDELADFAAGKALGALRGVPLYDSLPRETRRWARDQTRSLVASFLNSEVFDPVLAAVSRLAGETAEFLDDIRAIEPGDDLRAAVADLFFDRLEDAIREVFGRRDPGFRLTFTVPIINQHLTLEVKLPLRALVSAVRAAIRDLSRFDALLDSLVRSLAAMVDAENELVTAEEEKTELEGHQERTHRQLAETREPAPLLSILSPQPAAAGAEGGRLRIRIEGATPGYLGLEEGEQQRVFVWINQQNFPVSQLQAVPLRKVMPAAGDFSSRLTGSTGVLHPIVRQRALGQDLGRVGPLGAPVFGREANRPAATLAGLLGRPGSVQKNGGKTLVRSVGLDALPPGRSASPRQVLSQFGAGGARETLTLEAVIPPAMLHEGINTLVCAVVPGAGEKRVEQAVSFLVSDVLPPARGNVTVMPGRPVWNEAVLSAGVQRDLRSRLGAGRIAPDRVLKAPPKALASQLWYPGKAARKKQVVVTAADLKKALPVKPAHTKALLATVKEGRLRPVIQQVSRRRPDPV